LLRCAQKGQEYFALFAKKTPPNAAFVYKSIKAIPGLPFHEEQTRRLAEIFNQLARAI